MFAKSKEIYLRARRLSKSITFRLIVIGVAMVLVGSAVRHVITRDLIRNGMQDLVASQQLSMAQYAAEDIDEKIRARRRLLEKLTAELPVELLSQPDKLEAWLALRHNTAPLFSLGLVVIPPSGDGAIADYPLFGGRRQLDFTDRDWFLNARDKGQLSIGKPTIGRASFQGVVNMAAPVRDAAGRTVAVLMGVTALSMPGFLDLIQNHRIGKTGSFLLFSPQHELIVTATESNLRLKPTPRPGINRLHDQAMAGWRGAGVTMNAFGVENLAAFASVPSADWVVVARMPTQEAFGLLNQILGPLVRTSVIAALILALVLYFVLRYFFEPLNRSALLMRSMAAGELPLAELPVHRQDEVGDMVASFNALVQKVQQSESVMAHIADHDVLTGLANRRAFLTRLQQGVALAGRRGAGLAVVFMDLDGFKAVNDNHGHAVGDNLLQQVARRLKEGLRLSDSVGRLGGDEFLLLLQDCPDRESAAMIAQKLIAQISDPYTLGEVQVIIGASMGIAMFPEHANEPQELIALADAAMYAAKRGGRKTFRFSEAATDPVAQSRVDSHVSDRNATQPK